MSATITYYEDTTRALKRLREGATWQRLQSGAAGDRVRWAMERKLARGVIYREARRAARYALLAEAMLVSASALEKQL